MTTIIGIDPGQNGAMSMFQGSDLTAICPFSKYTYADIAGVLRKQEGDKIVYLEKVHTMPGQGIASSGKFMRDVGTWYGICIALGCTIYEVTPQTWQRAMRCLTKGDKNVSKRRAQELFPEVTVTHAIADALLIGLYGSDKVPIVFVGDEYVPPMAKSNNWEDSL